MNDPIGLIKKIQQVLDQYDATGEPKWKDQSNNLNKATAIFQKLRDDGDIKVT